jgi:hypothetical protein
MNLTENRPDNFRNNLFMNRELTTSSMLSSNGSGAAERKHPEEEYFRLSVLAVKMLMNEENQDYIFDISAKKLFKECKREEVPFHYIHSWIDDRLHSYQDDLARSQKKKKRGFMSKIKKMFVSKPEETKEMETSRILDKI